jgi:hypothetical protein
MKPGSMSSKTVWAFMLAAVLLTVLFSFLEVGGIIVPLALFGGLAFASTFLTKAGKGLAVGAWFVGSVLAAVGAAIAVMAAAGGAAEQAIADGGENAQLAAAATEGIGFIAALIGSVVVFFVAFVPSLIGSLVGAAARPKSDPAPAAAPPAAG